MPQPIEIVEMTSSVHHCPSPSWNLAAARTAKLSPWNLAGVIDCQWAQSAETLTPPIVTVSSPRQGPGTTHNTTSTAASGVCDRNISASTSLGSLVPFRFVLVHPSAFTSATDDTHRTARAIGLAFARGPDRLPGCVLLACHSLDRRVARKAVRSRDSECTSNRRRVRPRT